jgi:hypothetical protein
MAVKSKTQLKTDVDATITDGGLLLAAEDRPIRKDFVDSWEDFIGSYTTAQRDGLTPSARQIIYNTDVNRYQYWDGGEWREFFPTNQVLETKVTLTPAQILDSFSNPVELIPAPGAGKYIRPVTIDWFSEFNSVLYLTNVGGIIKIENAFDRIANFLINFTINIFGSLEIEQLIINLKENEPLIFTTDTGNPTDGDSDITFYITYMIKDL